MNENICLHHNGRESGMLPALQWLRPLLLGALLLGWGLGVSHVQGGVVIENRSNDTAVMITVYEGGHNMVLEIGLLDAGSVIDWDARAVATNFSAPWESSPPVSAEHLFVIKNVDDNSTITSQYFFDFSTITVVDDSIGGISIKALPVRTKDANASGPNRRKSRPRTAPPPPPLPLP